MVRVSTLLAGIMILVVESKPVNRQILIDILEAAGADTHCLDRMQEAMVVLHTFTPDCIVCNVNLPDGSGYELVRQLRQLEADLGATPTPAIAIFDSDRTINTQFAVKAGFQAIVVQPFKFEEVINTVLRVTGSSSSSG